MTQTQEKNQGSVSGPTESQEVCAGHECLGQEPKTAEPFYKNMEYADRIEDAIRTGCYGSALVGVESLPDGVPRGPMYALLGAALEEKALRAAEEGIKGTRTIADAVIEHCKAQSKYMQ